jgi:hypothetical protein
VTPPVLSASVPEGILSGRSSEVRK